MSTVVTVNGMSKRFGSVAAVEDVSFSLRESTICGLLGRNGAGKTTLMQVLAGQHFASAGQVEVFGEVPHENERVLSQVCFIKESQQYPDPFRVHHALRAARLLYPEWDDEFAHALLADFELPLRRAVKKLSRGMRSALGVIIGLASRAPLTIFDEPYLGLDAVARQLFYDRLLTDYAEHPRTVVLSSHLIDEISDLIEHVLVIDRGRILIDESAEALRGRAMTVTGPVPAVDEFAAVHHELHREQLANVARVTVRGEFAATERARAEALGLGVEPVSLQQLVVRTTRESGGEASRNGAAARKETHQ